MASARRDAALRQIHRLFDEGTLAGLPDARLLERYVAHRDELAFEALVRAAWADGPGRLPRRPRRSQRRRRCLPGRLPPAGPQGQVDLDRWLDRRLAPSRGLADRLSGQVRSRPTPPIRSRRRPSWPAQRETRPARRWDDTGRRDPPGDRPAARTLPPADRALLPGGHDLPAGRRSLAMERGDDPGPAGSGQAIAAGSADASRGDPRRCRRSAPGPLRRWHRRSRCHCSERPSAPRARSAWASRPRRARSRPRRSP